MGDKPKLVVFASTGMRNSISWKSRVAKIASTFTAEALAVDDPLEIFEKNRLGAIFRDSLELGKRAKRH
jgi:hypothetical protein